MLINQPMNRAAWRKLATSFKEAASAKYVPEYRDTNERSLNFRYYR